MLDPIPRSVFDVGTSQKKKKKCLFYRSNTIRLLRVFLKLYQM